MITTREISEINRDRSTPSIRQAELLLLMGAGLLVLSISTLSLISLTFLIKGSVSEWHLILGIAASGIYCFWFACSPTTTLRPTDALYGIFAAIGLLLTCVIVSHFWFDISWDGQAYHQEAVISLKNGWNPIYEKLPKIVKYPQWVNHYPKAPWMLESALYKITKSIESAKAFNFLFIICSLLWVAPTLLLTTKLQRSLVWVTALLLAFNPISIGQIFDFYIDGQVASLLLILGSLCCLLAAKRNYFHLLLLPFLSAIFLLVNAKFTALIYAAIFVSGLIVWTALAKTKFLYRFSWVSIFGFVLAIAVIGFNPYVLNTINHGHPFYPLAGSRGKADIISNQVPLDLASKHPIEKLIRSTFSISDSRPNTVSQLKLPFTVQKKEIGAFATGSARVAGFGALFSGAIVLMVLLGCNLAGQLDATIVRTYGFIGATIVASVLINPESWWARYVPQLWFVAPLSIVAAFHARKPNGSLIHSRRVSVLLGYALAIILSINCLGVFAPYLYTNVGGTWTIMQQLKAFAHPSADSLYIHFESFPPNRIRLEEAKIPFIEIQKIEEMPCKPSPAFFGSDTSFCLKKVDRSS